MSARQCPNCFAFVPPGLIVAYSYDLVCPSCRHPLEISALSQNLSAFAGLVAGAIVWRLAGAHYSRQPGALGWVLPLLFSYLAFSVVAPLALIFTADLKLKPLDSVVFQYEPPPSHRPAH
jgi:hypothetical protein